MIAHVILFKPRADLPSSERAALLGSLSRSASEIPGILRFRVGRRIRHGLPGYEGAMRESYEYAAIIEVEDLAALKAYLAHPAHAEFGRHFTDSAAAALAYDYELVDAAEAGSLVTP
jgi:hypothetical protein